MYEMKQMPFTKDDVINAVKNYRQADVDICSCWHCGKHSYYYVKIGSQEFQDGGKHHENNSYYFGEEVQKAFADIEQELLKENIVFVRKPCYLERGYSGLWHCVNTEELNCVVSIVKIKPSANFLELQKWLKKKADFNLKVTDLYSCDACQKRSSKTYSHYDYLAQSDYACKELLERIKATYKNGNKVVVNIVEEEHISNDPSRYEYEQYGFKRTLLQVIISTPSGRNERKIEYRA